MSGGAYLVSNKNQRLIVPEDVFEHAKETGYELENATVMKHVPDKYIGRVDQYDVDTNRSNMPRQIATYQFNPTATYPQRPTIYISPPHVLMRSPRIVSQQYPVTYLKNVRQPSPKKQSVTKASPRKQSVAKTSTSNKKSQKKSQTKASNKKSRKKSQTKATNKKSRKKSQTKASKKKSKKRKVKSKARRSF